jgi:putative ABC transport system permease protein
MLKNYLILAVRSLWKNKIFSSINIFGLSIGLAACISIILFVQYETDFDSFNEKNVYRLNHEISWEGMVQSQKIPLTSYPLAPTFAGDFPEVKNATHFCLDEHSAAKDKKEWIFFKRVFLTDSNFLKIFDFKLLKGNVSDALRNPRSIVLTKESAEKIFGKEDPMGRTLRTPGDTVRFTVTGILSVPKNSHLQFEALYSIYTYVERDQMNKWDVNGMVTYLELSPNTDIKAMERKFPAYLKKYIGEDATKTNKLFLQPLSEVHGGSTDITYDFNNFKKFDSDYTKIFSIIAFIVLITGCINFINLSIARSISRAKEVGVRKSIGANRFQLIMQFMSESVLLSLIAMITAIGMAKAFHPYMSQLSGYELRFPDFAEGIIIFKFAFGAILIGILSGFYPALYLSGFNTIKVLKGTVTVNTKNFTRSGLVVVQFASAAFLIIATIFVVRQLNFMQDRDAGFNKDQIVMLPGSYPTAWDNLKNELLRSTLIKEVSASSQKMGNSFRELGIRFYGNGPARDLSTSHLYVERDFLKLHQIKLVAGRDFTKGGEGKEFIVNERLAKELLKDDPKASIESLIGKRLIMDEDTTSAIVGVCRDFNYNSLHHKIETLCLYNKKTWGYNSVFVKIDGSRTAEALAFIEGTWKKIPNYPYEYEFLDEHFATLYEADKKVSKVVSILTGLAIMIACLGLLGLASYSVQRRIREIGIRKVLGSSVTNLTVLLSKDFVKLVVLANVIAWPLAWWVISKWLQNFAFRIDVSWWVFVVGGIGSLLIAFVTVSTQTIRAAKTNPVKNLRTE